jgi:O-acetyl-ADP-ribose deacetylase (regulator of RNase III)
MLVHICNDIGAWGRGFVVAISRRWPEPEAQYRAWHREGGAVPFELGQVQFVPVTDGIIVANLIGQHGIRASDSVPPVRYDAIRAGLGRVAHQTFVSHSSVHMPRIGCGLAGGRWSEIELIVREELAVHGIAVTVYDLPTSGG